MAGVKSRKGAVQEQKRIICEKCNKERKPILFINGKGKKSWQRSCDCGIFNKNGELIYGY